MVSKTKMDSKGEAAVEKLEKISARCIIFGNKPLIDERELPDGRKWFRKKKKDLRETEDLVKTQELKKPKYMGLEEYLERARLSEQEKSLGLGQFLKEYDFQAASLRTEFDGTKLFNEYLSIKYCLSQFEMDARADPRQASNLRSLSRGARRGIKNGELPMRFFHCFCMVLQEQNIDPYWLLLFVYGMSKYNYASSFHHMEFSPKKIKKREDSKYSSSLFLSPFVNIYDLRNLVNGISAAAKSYSQKTKINNAQDKQRIKIRLENDKAKITIAEVRNEQHLPQKKIKGEYTLNHLALKEDILSILLIYAGLYPAEVCNGDVFHYNKDLRKKFENVFSGLSFNIFRLSMRPKEKDGNKEVIEMKTHKYSAGNTKVFEFSMTEQSNMKEHLSLLGKYDATIHETFSRYF